MVIQLIRLCALIYLISGCSQSKFTEYKVEDKTMLLGNQTSCEFKDFNLPNNSKIYAIGNYKGRDLNLFIDKSSHKATQFDIVINSPNQPVALILGSYEPSVWNIGWTKNTKIIAIAASGSHRQILAGIEHKTPIIISTYDNKNECGYVYISESNKTQVKEFSNKIFQRDPDAIILANESVTVIGEQLNINQKIIQSNYVKLKDAIESSTYLVGEDALKKAVKLGVIRKVAQKDVDEWLTKYRANLKDKNKKITLPGILRIGTNTAKDDDFERRNFTLESIYHGYVIENDFTIPQGLNGINSATFFLKEGIAYPKGDLGHSTIFDFNTMSCNGIECEKDIQPVPQDSMPVMQSIDPPNQYQAP